MEVDRRSVEEREPLLYRHAAWLLVTFAYFFVFPYYQRINNPNENVRIWMTRAIVEHHVLNIDQVQREWGYVNDKATTGAHIYSSKAPGTSFLGVPVLFVHTKIHHLLGWPSPSKRQTTLWLRVFSVELPLAVFLFFFARYVERVSGSPTARDLLVVGLGVGTLLYPYAAIFVGHAQAAALAFAAYMLLSGVFASPLEGSQPPPGEGTPSSRQLAWAGALAGLSVIFEYQALLVCAILAVYTVFRYRRRALAFFAGAGVPAALLGVYHTVLFGRPWQFAYSHIENPEYRIGHSVGFHGLELPRLSAIGSTMFAPDYGLFIFSPVLAVGAVCAALVIFRGPRRDGILILSVTVVMLIFVSGMSNWRAGWCAGPRYIATVAPFLVAGIAHGWRVVRHRFVLSVLTAGLLLPSVVLNAVSAAVYPHYPTEFNNPVFDLAFPLLSAGFVPYSLGRLVLPGIWSLAPLAAGLLLALALGLSGEDRRPGRWALHAVLAVFVAAAFLVPLARSGRAPNAAEARATAFVRSTWEPQPTRGQ